MCDGQHRTKADHVCAERRHGPVCLRAMLLAALLTTALPGCGGGSEGGSLAPQSEAGKWDSMAWDQGQWG